MAHDGSDYEVDDVRDGLRALDPIAHQRGMQTDLEMDDYAPRPASSKAKIGRAASRKVVESDEDEGDEEDEEDDDGEVTADVSDDELVVQADSRLTHPKVVITEASRYSAQPPEIIPEWREFAASRRANEIARRLRDLGRSLPVSMAVTRKELAELEQAARDLSDHLEDYLSDVLSINSFKILPDACTGYGPLVPPPNSTSQTVTNSKLK